MSALEAFWYGFASGLMVGAGIVLLIVLAITASEDHWVRFVRYSPLKVVKGDKHRKREAKGKSE